MCIRDRFSEETVTAEEIGPRIHAIRVRLRNYLKNKKGVTGVGHKGTKGNANTTEVKKVKLPS